MRELFWSTHSGKVLLSTDFWMKLWPVLSAAGGGCKYSGPGRGDIGAYCQAGMPFSWSWVRVIGECFGTKWDTKNMKMAERSNDD